MPINYSDPSDPYNNYIGEPTETTDSGFQRVKTKGDGSAGGSLFAASNYAHDDIVVKPYNFNVGLGYRIKEKIFINLTMNYGLTNISPNFYSSVKTAGFEKNNTSRANSYSYTFSVAYMLHWKKSE